MTEVEMYTAVIVDDEAWIVSLLKGLVPWARLGIELTAVAYNGLDGLRAWRVYRPDILLVDIRMPGMDGLKLIQRLRESGCQSEIVVISGYSDFKYAKRAIDFDVLAYVLKPIDEQEIVGTLKRAKTRIWKKRKQRDEREKLNLNWKKLQSRLVAHEHTPVHLECGDPRIGRVLDYITENFSTDISLSKAAEIACMGATYFSEKFKNVVGVNFSKYLSHFRLERAKNLLSRTTFKISEVAKLTGYRDANYFAKKFVSLIGMKPTRYRQVNTQHPKILR